MSQLEIAVTNRKTGKGNSRGLRSEGMIPAVVYGKDVDSHSVYIDSRLVTKYATREFESTLFSLASDDKALNGKQVLIKSVQRFPATRKFAHVDLYAVNMSEEIRVTVEVRFEGSPVGVKEGGVFQPILREVEVETLPNKIPENLEIDVTELALGSSFHVSNLKMPEGVKAITSGDQTLCTVTAPAAEAPAEPEGGEAAAAEGAAEGGDKA